MSHHFTAKFHSVYIMPLEHYTANYEGISMIFNRIVKGDLITRLDDGETPITENAISTPDSPPVERTVNVTYTTPAEAVEMLTQEQLRKIKCQKKSKKAIQKQTTAKKAAILQKTGDHTTARRLEAKIIKAIL